MQTQNRAIESIDYKVIDSLTESYFQECISRAESVSPYYKNLWQEIYTLSRSGGKHLRSKMTLIAYEVFGGAEPASIYRVAAAQDLLHLSMLIHDDIIDRDYMRYGVKNIAGKYADTYALITNKPPDVQHFAQSAALLAGDLLIAGSFKLISTSKLNPNLKDIALDHLSTSIFEVAGGELLDTETTMREEGAIKSLSVARYKTASYSFIGPLLTGAQLAGAKESQIHIMHSFAKNLGIAYQLTDDILGTFGKPAVTGKPNDSDIKEGKITYIVECFRKRASSGEKELFDSIFGNANANEKEIDFARTALINSGAKSETEQKISEFINLANHALESLDLPSSKSQLLHKLISTVAEREY